MKREKLLICFGIPHSIFFLDLFYLLKQHSATEWERFILHPFSRSLPTDRRSQDWAWLSWASHTDAWSLTSLNSWVTAEARTGPGWVEPGHSLLGHCLGFPRCTSRKLHQKQSKASDIDADVTCLVLCATTLTSHTDDLNDQQVICFLSS